MIDAEPHLPHHVDDVLPGQLGNMARVLAALVVLDSCLQLLHRTLHLRVEMRVVNLLQAGDATPVEDHNVAQRADGLSDLARLRCNPAKCA